MAGEDEPISGDGEGVPVTGSPEERTRPEIRRAERSDLAAIVALLADDELGRRRETDGEVLSTGYLDAFAEIGRDPRSHLTVAAIEGRVVGTLHLTFLRYLTFEGGRRAQIEAVRVASDMRGHGIGASLLGWAVERAREQGAHLVQLTTDRRREDARRFYESLGFRATHDGMKLHLG